MAALEAVTLVSERVERQLRTALERLPKRDGDSSPDIVRFLHPFKDDEVMEPDDWPAIVTDLDMSGAPDVELEVQGKADSLVPMEIRYVTRDADTAQARVSASYVCRALVRVLSGLVGQLCNEMMLVQISNVSMEFWVTAQSHLGATIHFVAFMRDQGEFDVQE
jgi:hypothetical protein